MILGIKSRDVLMTNGFKLYLNNFQTAVRAGFSELAADGVAKRFSAAGKWAELTEPALSTLNLIDYIDVWSVPED